VEEYKLFFKCLGLKEEVKWLFQFDEKNYEFDLL